MIDLQKILTAPDHHKFSSRTIFWFCLSMAFSLSYVIPIMQKAFSGEYLIMDDARQHLFWMQRFNDPELFPNDAIAQFYQSVTPAGIKAVYRLSTMLGLDLMVANKILPLVLGLVTTGYCFAACIQILPVPAVGFVSAILLNQSLWSGVDLTTAAPTGFLYPSFLAFLYYLLRRSWLGVGISMVLLGIFYAPLMLVAGGILGLRLFSWERLSLQFSRRPRDYIIGAVGLSVALTVILLYFFQSSEFGPTITGGEARKLPEFFRNGRVPFFYPGETWNFWMKNRRSGIRLSINPPLVGLGLLLPLLLRFPSSFPLVKQVSHKIIVLLQWLLSSAILFFTAHAILFRLFLPSRYTVHSLRMIMAIAGGIALILILDGIFHQLRRQNLLASTIAVLIVGVLIFYPPLVWKSTFPHTRFIVGEYPELYQFLQQQPKDTLIASLASEASNLTSFAKRPVLIAWEYALPYHTGYYKKFHQRATDLIQAQYSPDLNLVQDFVNTYGVDFFLVEDDAFTLEYLSKNDWFKQWHSLAQKTQVILESNQTPILKNTLASCTVLAENNLKLVDANCVKLSRF